MKARKAKKWMKKGFNFAANDLDWKKQSNLIVFSDKRTFVHQNTGSKDSKLERRAEHGERNRKQ